MGPGATVLLVFASQTGAAPAPQGFGPSFFYADPATIFPGNIALIDHVTAEVL